MAIDVVVEEVADNLEEIAAATRTINTKSVGFFLVGAAIGFGVGAWWGYKRNKEEIRAEAFAQSEEEVEKIRELYQAKSVASTPKPTLEDVVAEQGYSVGVRPLAPPVPGIVEPIVSQPKDVDQGWDFERELAGRLEGDPYIIHQQEFSQNGPDYEQVVFTYYAVDDVLVDAADNHPVPHADLVVGLNNLRFGHGSDDADVVYVRNDRLARDMEICRLHDSFEEKVLGVDPEHSETDDDDEDS